MLWDSRFQPLTVFSCAVLVICVLEAVWLTAGCSFTRQFKWLEPEETGGRRVVVYNLDMFPPAGSAEEAAQTQVPQQ